MELPVRYQTRPGTERVVSVDGAFDAPGLNLSHWPGNRTPSELKRDLSTEIVLAFDELPRDEQRRLAEGCTAIVVNHFDTDGNCALFAMRHPDLARGRAPALVEAAAAGDFFQGASEQAFAIDCIVTAMVDPDRSPIARELAGLSDELRYARASEFLFGELPGLLDGDTRRFLALYEAELEALRSDVADLQRAARDDIAHLDWCVWTAPIGFSSTRAGAPASFDPGRHALFRGALRDRVLAIGPRHDGTTYRWVTSTLSWFELVSRPAPARVALEPLALALNELEGTDPQGAVAWRCHATASPCPELWFGRAQADPFAEHSLALEPSRLAPAAVRRMLAEALRGVLLLPQ